MRFLASPPSKTVTSCGKRRFQVVKSAQPHSDRDGILQIDKTRDLLFWALESIYSSAAAKKSDCPWRAVRFLVTVVKVKIIWSGASHRFFERCLLEAKLLNRLLRTEENVVLAEPGILLG